MQQCQLRCCSAGPFEHQHFGKCWQCTGDVRWPTKQWRVAAPSVQPQTDSAAKGYPEDPGVESLCSSVEQLFALLHLKLRLHCTASVLSVLPASGIKWQESAGIQLLN